ncbi:MAG: bifunctional folylpolyglutamate synthase/dihydrofolate synthase, partial [Chitinophagaceae bacterium]|nr:bifunctional folylpolyglutamate synthase/dihydrofolate synthase [Chitinophagaceae bacterium]
MATHINILMVAKIQYLYTMDYQSCIEYLYSKLPMFSRTGAAALKMNLSNTIALCEALGNPQQRFKTIHVAGTNGKGSVSHMLASVMQEAGFKTGLYTSPHLKDFRERIRINGEMISTGQVVHFTENIMELIDALEPSFFEVTVAMAFDHFAKEGVDVAIVETGLGGRLDSTNIIHPEMSIITNIGMDHVQLLGDTLGLIATEKAGIIKANVPVVIGQTHVETTAVFETRAKQLDAPIVFADAIWKADVESMTPGNISIVLTSINNGFSRKFNADLAGMYQAENIRTVITAIDLLIERDWKIKKDSIVNGIANAKINTGLHGRWEAISTNPLLILDVAHNTEGIKQVMQQINASAFEKLFIILGMSKDKDVEAVISMLPSKAYYGFTQASIPRALSTQDLEKMAATAGLRGHSYPDVNTAIEHTFKIAGANDLVLVCGSIFVVGEV